MIPASSLFWPTFALLSLFLFFACVIPAALSLRQRRWLLLPSLALLAVVFFQEQCTVLVIFQNAHGKAAQALSRWFSAMPPEIMLAALAAELAGVLLLLRSVIRYEKSQITSMSVKEAVDSLPAGVCMYLPSGQVILVNQAMEHFCRQATGSMLINGEQFRDCLFNGDLSAACERIWAGETPVIILPEGTVWALAEHTAPYRGDTVRRLLASEITEAYQKTLSLRQMQKTLSALNERLTAYNREIVALTAEKELLDARLRLHDQMGEDLLVMKRFILQNGTEAEQKEIETMLRRNVSFLKTGRQGEKKDEYALMLETAEKLGVHIHITGTLPQTEPQKHIIAAAIHECFTNTLRHARGDTLRLNIAEQEEQITIRFTNNGLQPTGPIRETGGLASLRVLAERAGGTLAIAVQPRFTVTLTLPKEVPNGLSGIDRG